MLETFLNKVTDEFKNEVLNKTRKEVYEILGDTILTEEQRNGIELFFVQPLYYSKMNYYMAAYYKHNETDVKSIISDPNISDEDKESFLSIMLQKLNLNSTGDNESDANLILNKLFYTSEYTQTGISTLKSSDSVFNVYLKNKTSFYFNENIATFLYDKPSTIYGAENLLSSLTIPALQNNIVSIKDLSKYNNDFFNTYYQNGALVLLNTSKIETKTVTLGSNSEEAVGIISGIFWDFIVEGNNSDYEVSEKNSNYFGFDLKTITVKVKVNKSVKITYKYIPYDPSIFSYVQSQLEGYTTKVAFPFRVDFNLSITKEANKDYLIDLTNDYMSYNDFFNTLINDSVVKLNRHNDIVKDSVALIYLSPLFYKRMNTNYLGIPFNESKILNFVNPDNVLIKLTKITCEDTGNVFTF